jgi:hypothetical protein
MVFLDTSDNVANVFALLNDQGYRKPVKDSTQSAEWKTTLLFKGSSLLEDVTEHL